MDISEVIRLNVLAILCFAALGGIFNVTTINRAFSAFWLGWLAVCLSGTGWVIYVAIHFISKYW